MAIVPAGLTDHRDPDCAFLFVDSWPCYGMEEMIPQMRRFHKAIPAARCFYRGQELDAVDWVIHNATPWERVAAGDFEAFRDGTGRPLVGLAHQPYPALRRSAAKNPAVGAARHPW